MLGAVCPTVILFGVWNAQRHGGEKSHATLQGQDAGLSGGTILIQDLPYTSMWKKKKT